MKPRKEQRFDVGARNRCLICLCVIYLSPHKAERVKPKPHFEEILQNSNDCVGMMQTVFVFFVFSFFPKSLKLELCHDATRKVIRVRQTFHA